MWTPAAVFIQSCDALKAAYVPYTHHGVITSRCQQATVGGERQTTHSPTVTTQFSCEEEKTHCNECNDVYVLLRQRSCASAYQATLFLIAVKD